MERAKIAYVKVAYCKKKKKIAYVKIAYIKISYSYLEE